MREFVINANLRKLKKLMEDRLIQERKETSPSFDKIMLYTAGQLYALLKTMEFSRAATIVNETLKEIKKMGAFAADLDDRSFLFKYL